MLSVISQLTSNQNLELSEIEAVVSEIEREKEQGMPRPLLQPLRPNRLLDAERKRSRLAATAAGQASMTSRAAEAETTEAPAA